MSPLLQSKLAAAARAPSPLGFAAPPSPGALAAIARARAENRAAGEARA